MAGIQLIDFADLAVRNAWVFHVPTGCVGKVVGLQSSSEVCNAPIVKLEAGHELLAISANFIELGKAEVALVDALQSGLSALVAVTAKHAAASGMSMDTGLAILVETLRSQMQSLKGRT